MFTKAVVDHGNESTGRQGSIICHENDHMGRIHEKGPNAIFLLVYNFPGRSTKVDTCNFENLKCRHLLLEDENLIRTALQSDEVHLDVPTWHTHTHTQD